MHPEVIKDAPGKCPKCGMDLVPVQKKANHEHGSAEANTSGAHSPEMRKHHHRGGHAHHAGMIGNFRRRFYWVLALTIPVMVLSPMIQDTLHVDWSFPGSGYILLILSSIIFFYGGKPFFDGFIDEIRTSSLGMMTLVAVAITVAYVYSVAIVLGLEGMTSFGNSLPSFSSCFSATG
jgi:Cu2+-exporting ATPase